MSSRCRHAAKRLALARPGLGPVRLQSRRLLGVGQGSFVVAELRVSGGPVREQFRALLGLRRALAAFQAARVLEHRLVQVLLFKSLVTQLLRVRPPEPVQHPALATRFVYCVGAQSGTIGYTCERTSGDERRDCTALCGTLLAARAHAAETSAAVAQLSGAARALLCRAVVARMRTLSRDLPLAKTCAAGELSLDLHRLKRHLCWTSITDIPKKRDVLTYKNTAEAASRSHRAREGRDKEHCVAQPHAAAAIRDGHRRPQEAQGQGPAARRLRLQALQTARPLGLRVRAVRQEAEGRQGAAEAEPLRLHGGGAHQVPLRPAGHEAKIVEGRPGGARTALGLRPPQEAQN